ncbi:major facilitator superfamily domain-containing protein [Dipodascopsis uninucleata]
MVDEKFKTESIKLEVLEKRDSSGSSESALDLNIPDYWPQLSADTPGSYYFWNKGPSDRDLDSIATQPSVFDDPDKAQLYQPHPKYENLHRFDPKERWTWREEISVVRKIDVRIMIWVCIMFMALEIDRGNLSQALADNMLDDLKLSTNDYNNGNTIFKLCFLVAEVPSQLVSKKLGADVWIPIQIIAWSAVSMAQFAIDSKASFYVTRALLGALQGGFIADVCLYLSYFYTAIELPVRLAYFWTAMTLADIVSSFMAFGILHMRGVGGRAGWQWLFMIEGAVTALIGIFAFLYLPASPTATKSWFRGRNGWFNEKEEKLIVNRALRDDPSKGDMHNRQAIDWKMFWKSVTDYDLWPIYIIGLTFTIPSTPESNYLTLTLRSLGFSTFQTTLMGLPYQVLHLVFVSYPTPISLISDLYLTNITIILLSKLLIVSYMSQRFNERSYHGLMCQVWVLVLLIPLRTFSESTSKWAKYIVTTLILCGPYTHAIQVGWTSRNSNSVRTRTVSAAMYNMFCQLGGIISNNIYRADDKPLYRRGNSVLIAINCMNLVIYLGTKFYYIYRNKQRDAKWKRMTIEERLAYISTTTDEGNKRLDFRFAH